MGKHTHSLTKYEGLSELCEFAVEQYVQYLVLKFASVADFYFQHCPTPNLCPGELCRLLFDVHRSLGGEGVGV